MAPKHTKSYVPFYYLTAARLATLPRPLSATFFFRSSTLHMVFGLIAKLACFFGKLIWTESDSTHGRDRRALATAAVQPTGQDIP